MQSNSRLRKLRVCPTAGPAPADLALVQSSSFSLLRPIHHRRDLTHPCLEKSVSCFLRVSYFDLLRLWHIYAIVDIYAMARFRGASNLIRVPPPGPESIVNRPPSWAARDRIFSMPLPPRPTQAGSSADGSTSPRPSSLISPTISL